MGILPRQTPDGQEIKPFLEHLEDLRRAIMRCLGSLVAGMAVALPLVPRILGLLKAPLRGVTENPDQFLRSLEVGGAFAVSMRVMFWAGLLFSAPLIVYFVSGFVSPGMTVRERGAMKQAMGIGAGLFAFGVWMGYRFTLPAALQIMFGMHRWLGIRAEWTITSYVVFATQLLIAFGLAFELPAVLLALGKLGVVSSEQLRRFRRHAIVGAFVVGMLLTPPDVFSQVLMAVPLVLLYEGCIWLVWSAERARRREGSCGPGAGLV